MIKHSSSRILETIAVTAACLGVSAGLIAQAPASQASTATASVTAGSYGSTVGGPSIYTVRFWVNGPNFTVPTTVPSTAKITSITGNVLGYQNVPYNDWVYVLLCADAGNTVCADFSPTASPNPNKYLRSWSVQNNTQLKDVSARTPLHWATYVDDGSVSSTHVALNPFVYSISTSTTINYTY